jgi:hypothetical protein
MIEWTMDNGGHMARAKLGDVLRLVVREIAAEENFWDAQVEDADGNYLLAVWPTGLATRSAACSAAIVLARDVLTRCLEKLPTAQPKADVAEWVCMRCESNTLLWRQPSVCRFGDCPRHGRVVFWPKLPTEEATSND